MEDKKLILKVLVGSRAHGLERENSDYDYRGVYIPPTREILSIGHNYKGTHWVEGREDNTSYELGHFLHLATKCNPSILEVFRAPVVEVTKEGEQILALFPYVWNPQDAFAAFTGYGLNQRKKLLEGKDDRPYKYAVAYLCTIYNLTDLLMTGTFNLKVERPERLALLKKCRDGEYTPGQIVDMAAKLTSLAKPLRDKSTQVPDLEKVNSTLLEIRRRNWE